MGYCYQGKRLVCDSCGGVGTTRKRACPFRYCPARAACATCYARQRAAGEHSKAAHASCARRSEEMRERDARHAALLAAGEAVRCSALGVTAASGGRVSDERVHVLFRRADGTTIGRYMSAATYHAIPFLEPATPADYARHGEVTEAPDGFDYGAEARS